MDSGVKTPPSSKRPSPCMQLHGAKRRLLRKDSTVEVYPEHRSSVSPSDGTCPQTSVELFSQRTELSQQVSSQSRTPIPNIQWKQLVEPTLQAVLETIPTPHLTSSTPLGSPTTPAGTTSSLLLLSPQSVLSSQSSGHSRPSRPSQSPSRTLSGEASPLRSSTISANWVGTIFGSRTAQSIRRFLQSKPCIKKFLIGGEEKDPSGRVHQHVYVQMDRARNLIHYLQNLTDSPDWWAPLQLRGLSLPEAKKKWIRYCMQSKRNHSTNFNVAKYLIDKEKKETQSKQAMDLVLAGTRPNVILKLFPGCTQLKNIFQHYPPRDFETECIFIHGPSRSGKSKAIVSVLQAFNEHYGWTHYNKLMKFDSDFWDGYNNDEITYIDDPLLMDRKAFPERKILSMLKTLLDTP